MTPADLAQRIEHTELRPGATAADIARLCQEARRWRCGGVCVAPAWVPRAAALLRGAGIRLVTVAGFPHGDTLPPAKAREAALAVAAGAEEVDMVLHAGMLRSGEEAAVAADILGVVEAVRAAGGKGVKVILECGRRTDAEKRRACALAEAAGAGFVKTATGFGPGGATVEDVRLLRDAVGTRLGVKAAGGIRTAAAALALLEAGADRLGCSASVAILEALRNRSADSGSDRT
ncbi:MAG: deoxyribose-phosphate aldolase [Gammaproteobacteria bacterium]|nr:deoxyribose-phosphate aldolase [Gammaproteobacteria bacterium]